VIGVGLTWAARWSARLLLVAAGIWLLGFLVGQLWTVVFPTLLAIVLATVLWPPAAWLRRHRFAPALASAVVVLVAVFVIAVLVALVGSAVSGSMPQIVRSVIPIPLICHAMPTLRPKQAEPLNADAHLGLVEHSLHLIHADSLTS